MHSPRTSGGTGGRWNVLEAGPRFGSTKLAAARGALALATLSALLLITPTRAGAQTETVLYSFCAQSGCTDGNHPEARLVLDPSGNLYGTTDVGGANALGTVFEVSASGSETVLYSFCSLPDCDDGDHPRAGLILDAEGNLYGGIYDGGTHDGGIVAEFSPTGAETVLYDFCSKPACRDGYYPHSDLVMDKNGNLYGTTYKGGANGEGVVYEVSPSGIETVLYSFCAQAGCKDGSSPEAGLVLDAKGNLYGTTYSGGGPKKRGTVFEVSPSGTETVLHSFNAKGTDGYNPSASLVMDAKGNLYGTTYAGGAHGGGTVFEVTP